MIVFLDFEPVLAAYSTKKTFSSLDRENLINITLDE